MRPKCIRRALAAWLCGVVTANVSYAEPVIASVPRASICLNGEWESAAGADAAKIPGLGWSAVRISLAPVLDPKISARWCRVAFTVPKDWAGEARRFHVEFEKIGHYAAVFCNGQKVGEHFGQDGRFVFDVN